MLIFLESLFGINNANKNLKLSDEKKNKLVKIMKSIAWI